MRVRPFKSLNDNYHFYNTTSTLQLWLELSLSTRNVVIYLVICRQFVVVVYAIQPARMLS